MPTLVRFRAFSMLASVRCGNRRSIAKMRSTNAMVSQVKPLSSNNVTTVSQVSLRRKKRDGVVGQIKRLILYQQGEHGGVWVGWCTTVKVRLQTEESAVD